MRIKDIPWYNRPGIRLKKNGDAALSNAGLFFIFIGTSKKIKKIILISQSSNTFFQKFNDIIKNHSC